MKSVKYIVLLILCLFTFNVYALKTSHYEATFEMDEEFQGNQIVTYYGYLGEDTYKTEFKITIDTTMIELDKVIAGENYQVDYKEVKTEGKYKTYLLNYSSGFVTNKYIYGGISFKLKDKFQVGKSSEMKVYDIISTNDNGKKYRSEGYYIVLKREGTNNMLALRTNINQETKNKRLINTILPYAIAGLVIIFLLAIIIVIIPSSRHSDVKRKIDSQLDAKNYPIPGVGPLPKVKKKEKQDIIEPEEKTIMPLSEFVSKSDEENPELKNKPLEVDDRMFESNPTKEGEGGLININPLAFDDGEDTVLDDGTNSNTSDDSDDDITIL